MKSRIRGLAALAITGIAALVFAPLANATIEIRLINTVSSTVVADTGWMTNAGNVIVFNGPVGNYSINVSTGLSQIGTNPFLDLNSVNVATTAPAGLLTIEVISNGYTMTAPQFNFQVGGTNSIAGPGGSNALNFSAFGGNNNLVCPAGLNSCSPTSLIMNSIASLGSYGTGAFSGSVFSASGTAANPYSLGVVGTINGASLGVASFDAAINAVPEPVSVSLLGGVLLFTASAFRRKLRRRT